jgi:tetratricopeptide (TPR) repeat protein
MPKRDAQRRRTQERPTSRSSRGNAPPTEPAGGQAFTGRSRVIVGIITLAVATFIAYLPSLHGGILWDDPAYITAPALRSLDGLRRIWFSPGATLQYYPMLYSTFWVEWQLWQLNTFAYHLIKVAEHVAAASLLWAVLRSLRIPGAWFASAAFALHPVSVESVAWISEQKNTLSAIFYFAAAWCYLRFDADPADSEAAFDPTKRPRVWYVLALVCFALAVLSKSVTATLPAVLLVIMWWLRGRLDARRDVLPLIPWFIVAAAAGSVTAWFEHAVVGAQGSGFELGLLERALLAGRVVWFYLLKLLWPSPLIFFYPRWVIEAADWRLWLSLVALLLLFAALVWMNLLRRTDTGHTTGRARRAPLAALLTFVATLVPVLGFLNVYPFRFSYVADHFQYLAQVSIITLGAAALATVAHRSNRSRQIVGVAAIAILATYGWLTWKQSDQYGHDAIYHYRAILEQNPSAWIAYENWAGVLMQQRKFDEAIPLLRKTIEAQPEYFEAVRDLATSLDRTGQPEEALSFYERAVRLDPDPKGSENAYGTALLRANRVAEAIPHLERAVALANEERNPIYLFELDLGRAYVEAGRVEDGIAQFRRTREGAGPSYPLPGYDAMLGSALVRLGRDTEAEPYLRRAVELDTSDPLHRLELGRILYKNGQYADAAKYLEAAGVLRPDLADVWVGLAFTYHSLGRDAEARRTAERAVDVASRTLPPETAARLAQTVGPLMSD